jgi:hypothetical protein
LRLHIGLAVMQEVGVDYNRLFQIICRSQKGSLECVLCFVSEVESRSSLQHQTQGGESKLGGNDWCYYRGKVFYEDGSETDTRGGKMGVSAPTGEARRRLGRCEYRTAPDPQRAHPAEHPGGDSAGHRGRAAGCRCRLVGGTSKMADDSRRGWGFVVRKASYR